MEKVKSNVNFNANLILPRRFEFKLNRLISVSNLFSNLISNKKVLLRERYTARRVASARYAALSNGGRGVPHPVMVGGTHPVMVGRQYPIQSWGVPIQSWWWGVPHPVMVGGTPHHPDLARGYPGTLGYPLSRPGMGYLPPSRPGCEVSLSRPGMEYPPPRPGMEYPPPDLGWITPPPPQMLTDRHL